MRTHTWRGIAAIAAFTAMSSGCGSVPTTPSESIDPNSMGRVRPGVPQPTVISISPPTGTTGGYTRLEIQGEEFQDGAIVTFDGFASIWKATLRDGIIYVSAPPHPPGTVDVRVINPNGQSDIGRYSYASPQSLGFTFDGTWRGMADGQVPETVFPLELVIRDGALTRVSCGNQTVHVSPPATVSGADFSFTSETIAFSGSSFSGQMHSANGAVGAIDIAPCADTWGADKQ